MLIGFFNKIDFKIYHILYYTTICMLPLLKCRWQKIDKKKSPPPCEKPEALHREGAHIFYFGQRIAYYNYIRYYLKYYYTP